MNIGHIILYAIVPIIVVMLAGYLSGKKGSLTATTRKSSTKWYLITPCRQPCLCL